MKPNIHRDLFARGAGKRDRLAKAGVYPLSRGIQGRGFSLRQLPQRFVPRFPAGIWSARREDVDSFFYLTNRDGG